MQQDGFPDFFIIGAAKAGTSSLFTYLCRHPHIQMSSIKEPQYYSDDSIFARGPEWYNSLFQEKKGAVLRGEASTTYSRYPHTPDVPARIYEDTPSAKFIYIMRNPVARAYSHYCHHMREGITMTFEEALEKNTIYTDCSLYIEQISLYLKLFKKEQMLFLLFDDFIRDPAYVLELIQDFLVLKRQDLLVGGQIFNNKTGSDHYIRKLTTRKFRRIGFVNKIAERTPQEVKNYLFAYLKKIPYARKIEKSFRYPVMTEDTKERLLDYFLPYNDRLGTFLGKDLKLWNHYYILKEKLD